MSAARDEVSASLAESVWERLRSLEDDHQRIQLNHERARRSLDSAVATADRNELRAVWDIYRAVIAELEKATERIEALRLTSG